MKLFARYGRRVRLIPSVVVLALIMALLPGAFFSPAAAAEPDGVNFGLEGCDLTTPQSDPSSYDPDSGDLVCDDASYGSGNLGKNWNELDLVPFRITAETGNNDPVTQTYTVIIVVDHMDAGHPGYDVLSAPVLNTALSDASCTAASASAEQILSPGVGGIDESLYRELTITHLRGDTCVYDFYARLAVGSHLFPGSSLHANLLNEDFGTGGVGAQDRSIPVNEILPQELDKTMSATRDADHMWSITKEPTPAELDFTDTCDPGEPLSQSVSIQVTWTKLPADPNGDVNILTQVYATNPAARTITVEVEDQVYEGTDQTTPVGALASSGPVDVPPNTASFLVLTNQFTAASTATHFNDVATASYTDTLTGVPVPGQTTAVAEADVQAGTTTNTTATINDVEDITGTGLTFSVDGFTGATGAFDGGYVAGTPTPGPVSWTSDTQTDSGSVTFDKTVYATAATAGSGELSDTATLTGSDGFSTTADADVSISVQKFVDLTIEKTLSGNPLEGSETATFIFDVFDGDGDPVTTVSLTFGANDTTMSTVVADLPPDVYTVYETAPAGWSPSDPAVVDLTSNCSGTAPFTNSFEAQASARVQKVTVPGGFEAGWTFDLLDGDGNILETVVTTDGSFLAFTTQLGEGSYTIVETTQDGWSSDGGSAECSFTVNLPADADRVFSCTFTNTYQPSVTLEKDGEDLSKIGDTVDYEIVLTNTSSSGGAAGVPHLECTISDPTVGVDETVTLGPGADHTVTVTDFEIPETEDDPFPNEATADCTFPELSEVVASASADHDVNLFQPGVTLEKDGPAYSKVGDTVTYEVTITNTSSEDAPNLVLDSFSDTKVAGMDETDLPAECQELAYQGSCTFEYTYTVLAGDDSGLPGAELVNEAEVHYHPAEFENDIDDSDDHSVTLLHPNFTVGKTCDSEPVSQDGPATFTVTFENTGDADLVITADDGIGMFPLAAGASTSFTVTENGPFGGQATVSNTVNASAVLAEIYGLSNTVGPKNATDACDVGSRVEVLKKTQGAIDASQNWVFEIYTGPDGFDAGTLIASATTLGDADGVLTFGDANLDPNDTYTLCERSVPAGWTLFWQVDTDGDGVADTTVIPYNPDADNTPPENLGNYCIDFGAGTPYPLQAGETLHFAVDNQFPGGAPRTPGYWKNWNRCTGGGQDENADRNGGWEEGFWLVEDVLDPTIGGGIVWDDILPTGNGDIPPFAITQCAVAVDILDGRKIGDPAVVGDGKKMTSDAAYLLALHLLAAQMNFASGAESCQAAQDAALDAEELLDKYNFNGTGDYLGPKVKGTKLVDRTLAIQLAATLDQYNNGNLC